MNVTVGRDNVEYLCADNDNGDGDGSQGTQRW